MVNESLKAAARAGQPKAIEALMNKSFEKEGITARVIKSGELLKVTLRSKNLPDPKKADLVKKGIASITPEGISKVSLRGEQIGGKHWSTDWAVNGSPSATPKKAATVITSSSQGQKWYQRTWVVIPVVLSGLLVLATIGAMLEEPIVDAVVESDVETKPETVEIEVTEAQPKPTPIYPSRQPTELEIFQDTLELKTPGVLATGEIGNMNLNNVKQSCPTLVSTSSTLGINNAISRFASELRLQYGYDEKLATNLATGLIEGCAAWERGDRSNPGLIVDRSKPPLNKAEIDRWESEYGSSQ